MKTDDLIRALAADSTPLSPSVGRSVTGALVAAVPLSFAVLVASMGFRQDIANAPELWRFVLKYAVMLPLAMASLWLALRMVRPGAETGAARWALTLAPLVLAIGVARELASLPPEAWARALLGQTAGYCVSMVPLLSAPILAALLVALRRGAPASPMHAGAVAGLCAAALGSAVYALHCTDDSPLFLAAWYGIGIATMTLAGALAGRVMLRW